MYHGAGGGARICVYIVLVCEGEYYGRKQPDSVNAQTTRRFTMVFTMVFYHGVLGWMCVFLFS